MRDSRAFGTGRRAWFIAALALVFVTGLAAEAKSPDRLSELMERSGFDAAFDQLGASIKAGTKQALASSPLSAAYREKVLAGLDPAADVAFAPETLKREFRRALDGKLTEADLDIIFAFQKSPLGARMTALEKASNAGDAEARIAEMAGELLERLKREPERAEVLNLMDSSLRLTEISTDIAFNTARAVAVGMAAADEKTAALPAEAFDAVDAALQRMRPAMSVRTKEQILLWLAYAYRDVSIADLRQYLVFLTSPAGKKYYGAIVPAMNKVLVKAGEEFGHALMKELGKEQI